jgi:hypothetical protein
MWFLSLAIGRSQGEPRRECAKRRQKAMDFDLVRG